MSLSLQVKGPALGAALAAAPSRNGSTRSLSSYIRATTTGTLEFRRLRTVCSVGGAADEPGKARSDLRRGLLLGGLASTLPLVLPSYDEEVAHAAGVESLYDLTVMQYGEERSLSDFKGKVSNLSWSSVQRVALTETSSTLRIRHR